MILGYCSSPDAWMTQHDKLEKRWPQWVTKCWDTQQWNSMFEHLGNILSWPFAHFMLLFLFLRLHRLPHQSFTTINWGLGVSENLHYHSMHWFPSFHWLRAHHVTANNCLQIMVCSCMVPFKPILTQIIFCSCVIGNMLSREKMADHFPELPGSD